MIARFFAPAAALAALVQPGPAEAGRAEHGVVTFAIENDVIAGTDRFYTNGFQFSYLSPPETLPPLFAPGEEIGRLFMRDDAQMRWGLSLGQQIYTPTDTARVIPDPGDRPYAGYLFLSASIVGYAPARPLEGVPGDLGTLELYLGVVGPSALGEQVQNNFHDLIKDNPARGWDAQLKDEPALMLIGERKWQIQTLLSEPEDGIGLEVSPHVAVALGNVQTYAALGATVRLGQGLAADFGAPRLRPALSGSGFLDGDTDFGWYLFAGVEGRAVAQDIFLDGNTWRDSPSVEKEHFVADAQLGVAVLFRGARLTWSFVIRSEEFDGQDAPARFGALSLSTTF